MRDVWAPKDTGRVRPLSVRIIGGRVPVVIAVLVRLDRSANQRARPGTNRSADRRALNISSDRRTDDGSGGRADTCTLPSRRITRTKRNGAERRQCHNC